MSRLVLDANQTYLIHCCEMFIAWLIPNYRAVCDLLNESSFVIGDLFQNKHLPVDPLSGILELNFYFNFDTVC